MQLQDTEFPTLYKKTNTGAVQFWEIRVTPPLYSEAVRIITKFGQLGTDSPQETSDSIEEGKNAGKKNATTPFEQAVAEAKGKWEKMQKKGYVSDRARAEAGSNDLRGVDCMLAHKYSEQAEKIDFPAAVQPKLDGIRCLTKADGTLWSRTQKPITSVPHIVAEIKRVFGDNIPNLDGELYNHDYKNNFEKIVSIARQTKGVHPEHELVQYHVYDIAGASWPFSDRRWRLKAFADALGPNSPVRIVETGIADSHDALMAQFHEFRSRGYEGAMVRNLAAPYEGKRSYGLQKVKEFDDAEFKILAALEGRGKLQGHVGSFTCQVEGGATFEVKMEGELSHLKTLWEHPELWEGRMLTVKYQGMTGKNKVPRFPVGLRIREGGL